MKSKIVIALLLFTIKSRFVNGQNYYFYNDKYYDRPLNFETGFSLGAMNALADLGGRRGIGKPFLKDLNIQKFKPAFSFYGAVNYNDQLYLRLEFARGSVYANDQILEPVKTTAQGRYERNLHFRSPVTELVMALEVHPLMFRYYDNGTSDWSPYFVAGVGAFHFNPQAQINNRWYDLHPLRTEGQGFAEYPERKPYNKTQVNFPVGIGVRYELSATVNLRFEIVHRILTTDYLDDVSENNYIPKELFAKYLTSQQSALATQLHDRRLIGFEKASVYRGNPKDRDAFFSFQFKMGYTFRKRKS